MSNHYACDKSNESCHERIFCSCCGCICSFLFLLIVFMLFYPIAFRLAFHPKQPEFNLQHVDVKYLHIGPNKVGDASTAAYITLDMKLQFAAVNPNKWLISIKESKINVSYRGGVLLGTVAVPQFDVPENSTRLLDATMRLFERLDLSLLHRHNHTVDIQITGLVLSTVASEFDRVPLPSVSPIPQQYF